MKRYILTLQCPDQPGIVRGLADGIFTADGNILESSQFSDAATKRFFMRISFDTPRSDVDAIHETIVQRLKPFGTELMLQPQAVCQRAMIMVFQARPLPG